MEEIKVHNEKKTAGACCCSGGAECSAQENPIDFNSEAEWMTGVTRTAAGPVPRVSTRLSARDLFGSFKARWGINRMNYKIPPGLYCVGEANCSSPVFVTANYKMSFDTLRKELEGINAWIMVLDTKGINVWCAAGKGTFGTCEVVNRISKTKLESVVCHRTLILPQLGAPGVSAHEVARKTGFRVVYGPVRAADIPEFLEAGMKASPQMRTVKFNIVDRLVLTPIEVVAVWKPALIVLGILFILSLMGLWPVSFSGVYPLLGAVLAGCVITPLLLPWIPGRAFAFKGWLIGILWSVAVIAIRGESFATLKGLVNSLFYLLMLPAISSFLAMNFTGASTYTSLSGVVREMKTALPLIIVSAGLGVILMAFGLFIKFRGE